MTQYNVTGMSCAACSARVEKAVSRVPGVTSCSVSLLTNSMGVEGSAAPQDIIAAVQAVGSQVLWPDDALHRQLVKALPSAVSERIQLAKAENITAQPFDAVIFHGDSDQLRALCEAVAARDGAIVSVQGFARGESNILLERLYIERSLSVNTAAAGGNASLMTIG